MEFTIIDSGNQLNVNGMFLIILYIFFSYLISRRIVNANIFNIASFSLFVYWVTYPLENLKIDGDMYSSISGIKERGIILYAIFGFTFLIGSYILSKANLPRFPSLPKVNSLRYLIILSIISGSLGLFCFLYSYNFSINQYFFSIFNLSRIDRLAEFSKSNNALPYSIFFIPSVIAILISLKSINFKSSIPIY